MGLFSVGCLIENQQDRARSVRVSRVMVDTGSELTWINHKHLEKIGIEPEKKDKRFILANGQHITRSIGFAIIRVGKELTTDEVVFAQKGDLQLLGARTLEGLNLKVDARNKSCLRPARSSPRATEEPAETTDPNCTETACFVNRW